MSKKTAKEKKIKAPAKSEKRAPKGAAGAAGERERKPGQGGGLRHTDIIAVTADGLSADEHKVLIAITEYTSREGTGAHLDEITALCYPRGAGKGKSGEPRAIPAVRVVLNALRKLVAGQLVRREARGVYAATAEGDAMSRGLRDDAPAKVAKVAKVKTPKAPKAPKVAKGPTPAPLNIDPSPAEGV